MPKVTLHFNLPKERGEYNEAMNGGNWKLIVYELSIFLRTALKHGHGYKTADEALEAAKTTLLDLANEYHIDPWEDLG